MTSRHLHARKGFTLIELLIVIVIIGVLAVALLPSLTGGTERARDAQRKGDLAELTNALEYYYNDNGSAYPSGNLCVSAFMDNSAEPDLTPYLTTDIVDPSANSSDPQTTLDTIVASCGDYIYIETGTGYILAADLENNSDGGQSTYDYSSLATAAGNSPDGSDTRTVLASLTDCSDPNNSCTDVVYVIGR